MIHISINDLYLDNILLDEISYEYLLFYDVAYKTPYGAKPSYTIFDKVDGYIRKYDRRKYLGLFQSRKYLIMLKINISDVYSYKRMRIKINSDDDLPSEKLLNMHNVVIFIKSIVNKNHNNYYYQLFFRKM